MSHFTTVKTIFAMKRHLLQALDDLKLAYEEGENLTVRGYGGRTMPAEIKVLTGTHGYDIGFAASGDTYRMIADWWGIEGLSEATFLRQLTQRYAYNAAKEQLEAQDFTLVEETVEEDQTIHLQLRKMA